MRNRASRKKKGPVSTPSALNKTNDEKSQYHRGIRRFLPVTNLFCSIFVSVFSPLRPQVLADPRYYLNCLLQLVDIESCE